jgi:hypothetical protein
MSIKEQLVTSWCWYAIAILVAILIPNQLGIIAALPFYGFGVRARRGIPDVGGGPFELARSVWPHWPLFAALWYVPVSVLLLLDAIHGGHFLYTLSNRTMIVVGLGAICAPLCVLALLGDIGRIRNATRS